MPLNPAFCSPRSTRFAVLFLLQSVAERKSETLRYSQRLLIILYRSSKIHDQISLHCIMRPLTRLDDHEVLLSCLRPHQEEAFLVLKHNFARKRDMASPHTRICWTVDCRSRVPRSFLLICTPVFSALFKCLAPSLLQAMYQYAMGCLERLMLPWLG